MALLDRERAARVHKIIREATLPPVFLRPLSKVRTFNMRETHIDTVVEKKQFLRKRFHIQPKSQQSRSLSPDGERRGLLATRVSYKTGGSSNYLNILRQKAQAEAQEVARLELSMSQPISPYKKEADLQIVESILVPRELSKSCSLQCNTFKSTSGHAIRTLSKMLENDVMWCNCASKLCTCGKASIKALVAHPPNSPLYSIEDMLLDCQEVTRYTWKVRNTSMRHLPRVIADQKQSTRKFLRCLRKKMRECG